MGIFDYYFVDLNIQDIILFVKSLFLINFRFGILNRKHVAKISIDCLDFYF